MHADILTGSKLKVSSHMLKTSAGVNQKQRSKESKVFPRD